MSSVNIETRERILIETWRLMEEKRGHGVSMEDVAKAAKISRQAVYLHFPSRAELLIATVRYVDHKHGIEERLASFRQAQGGRETLQAYVKFWGNYIPEIYGLARALLEVRENDLAAAAAWDDRMEALRYGCRCVIECLDHEGSLASEWTTASAIDMLWGMSSITLWENLTIDRGWTQNQYLEHMQATLVHTFVKPSLLLAEVTNG